MVTLTEYLTGSVAMVNMGALWNDFGNISISPDLSPVFFFSLS